MTVLQANNLLLSRLANQCPGLLQTFCSLTLCSSRKRLINIYTLTQYLQERAITEACVWSYSELITFLARYPFKQSFSAFFSALILSFCFPTNHLAIPQIYLVTYRLGILAHNLGIWEHDFYAHEIQSLHSLHEYRQMWTGQTVHI